MVGEMFDLGVEGVLCLRVVEQVAPLRVMSMQVARDDEYDSAARHEIRKADGSPLSRAPPIGRFQFDVEPNFGGIGRDCSCASCAAPDAHVLLPRLGSTPWQGWLREHCQKRFPTFDPRIYFTLNGRLCSIQELGEGRAGKMGLGYRTTNTVIVYLGTCPVPKLLAVGESRALPNCC